MPKKWFAAFLAIDKYKKYSWCVVFEQVFPHFFLELNKKYPDLTAAEVRLAALDKLNLADKVRGTMLGISADSVKKTRYWLRKKYPSLM